MDESFDLVLEVRDGSPGDPDFSPLEQDFEILGNSQSQNIQMINGNMSRSLSWTLTLMAKRTGNLQIPAIDFGPERSKPLSLQVLKSAPAAAGQPSDQVFLQVEAQPESPYVQAQLLVTVRLFVANTLQDVRLRKLTDLKLEGVDAVIERVGEDQQYRAQHAGRSYTVLERRYAVFPQESGNASLEPVLFEGEQGRGIDPFSLFNGRAMPGRGSQILRSRSESKTITIRPAPANAGVQPWLPAEHMQLAETWSEEPDKVQVGQPITRTLALIADGLTSAQLPPLTSGHLPDGLKAYPDQPLLQDQANSGGITGSRQEKIALVASRPGSYTLPAIEIAWWSTKDHRREALSIPARQMQVVAAAAGSAPAASTAVPVPAPASPESPPAAAPPMLAAATAAAQPGPFVWLSLFLGIGWVLTLLAWWRSRRRTAQPPRDADQATPTVSTRAALARVRQAYQTRDAAAASHALLEWGRARWPHDPPTNLGELARRGGPDIARSIEALSRARYGREGMESWHQDPVWQRIEKHGVGKERPHKRAIADPLAELNP
jgi:hypothetical protein